MMSELACFLVAYLGMSVLLVTVMGVSKLLNEHKQGTLKTMNKKEFLIMVILLFIVWPLLVMDRATQE